MSRRSPLLILAALVVVSAVFYLLRSRPGSVPPVAQALVPEAKVGEDVQSAELLQPPTGAHRQVTGESSPSAETDAASAEWEEEPSPETNDGLVIRIEDAKGLPVVGAEVELDWRRGFGEYFTVHRVTNASGEVPSSMKSAFQMEGVTVKLPGRAGEWTDDGRTCLADLRNPHLIRYVLPGRVQLEVHASIEGGGSLEGTFLQYERAFSWPVRPGVNELWSGHPGGGGPLGRSGKVLLDLEARAYRIRAVTKDGRSEADMRVGLAGGEESQKLALVLRPIAALDEPMGPSLRTRAPRVSEQRTKQTGRVIDAVTGAPIRGASLSVVEHLPKSGQGGEPRSDEQGRFAVTGTFDRETEFLFAREREYAWAALPLNSVPPGQPITITMEPKLRIEGRAVDADGVPVEGWAMLFTPRDRVGLPPSGAGLDDAARYLKSPIERIGTGSAGRFHFNGATGEPHRIWFQPDDPDLPPGVAIARGGDLNVVIEIGDLPDHLTTVRGVVRDAVTGEPAPNLHVRVWGEHTSLGAAGMTNAAGAYVIAGLEPGEFTCSIEHKKEHAGMTPYAFKRRTIQLSTGEQTLDLSATPARTLHLRLLGGSPQGPLPFARVEVLDADGDSVGLQSGAGYLEGPSTSTDWNGRVDLLGVPAEKVELHVWLDGEREGEPDHIQKMDARPPQTELLTLRF